MSKCPFKLQNCIENCELYVKEKHCCTFKMIANRLISSIELDEKRLIETENRIKELKEKLGVKNGIDQ